MTVEPELDCGDMANVHYATARWGEIRELVIAGRKAFDTFSLPDEEQRNLDLALERFSAVVPYEDEPCEYCSSGAYSGLPGGACENCMSTGLKYNGN